MFPSSVAAVVVFLLLVAPGVAFELARQRRRPARQDSAFLEAARVLLAGVTLGLAGICLLGIARLAGPGALVVPSGLIAHTVSYTADNAARVLATVLAYVVVTLTLAVLAADCRPYGGSEYLIIPDSAWFMSLARYAPEGSAVHLAATTADGTAYLGRKEFFTADPAMNDRELVLQPPLSYRAPGTSQTLPMADEWHRLILPASNITSLAISYVRDKEKVAPTSESARLMRIVMRWRQTPWWKAALIALVVEFAVLITCAAALAGP